MKKVSAKGRVTALCVTGGPYLFVCLTQNPTIIELGLPTLLQVLAPAENVGLLALIIMVVTHDRLRHSTTAYGLIVQVDS